MQEAEQYTLDQIRDYMRAGKNDELEALWLEVIDGEPKSLSFHEGVMRYLLNKKELERLREMYGAFAEQVNTNGHFQHSLDVLGLTLQYDPSYTALRRHLMTAMRGMNPDRPEERMDEFFRISGLDGDAPDLLRALHRCDDLLGAAKGQVFKHSQWGLGIVVELDAREGWAIIDFHKKPQHRMTLVGMKDFLQRIPNDHIYTRIAKTPEEFKKEIHADPCAAIRLALKNSGGKLKAPDLKKILLTGFLTDAEFKKWWTKAKDVVRLDPFIDLTGKGANTLLTLRSHPRTFADEIRVKLIEAKTLEQRRLLLRDVAKHGAGADLAEEDTKALELLFLKPFQDGAIETDADKFGHGLLFEEYSDLFTKDAKNPVDMDAYYGADRDELSEMIADVGIFELQRIALEKVLEKRQEDAPATFSEVFFAADTRMVAWMEKKLESLGSSEVMENCVERILSNPKRNPDVFVWAAKKVFGGSLDHIKESMSLAQIIEIAMTAMDELEGQAHNLAGDSKKILEAKANKLRLFVQEGTLKNVKKAIRECDINGARRFITTVNMMGGLTNQLRTGIEQIVNSEHPSLTHSKRSDQEEEARSAIHYSTVAAIEAKRQELSNIVSVEIPKNSEAIGIARGHGDLKENSEYHAAKDRQKLLMQTAKELEDLLSRARPIELEKVKTDQIRFGTRATLENLDSGETEVCSLMGMWEANADKKIISYLTPFGSQIMNKKMGEEFEMTLPDGRVIHYKVKNIEQAQEEPVST